jgi:uncharacterized protein YggE
MLRLIALSTLTAALSAQPQRLVQAVGEASISVQPDQVRLNVGVVTTAATAEEAANQNAVRVDAVLAKLRELLGPAGEIKTVAYSITPNYQYPREGGPGTIVGYTCSNTVQISTTDLNSIGRLLDAAIQAGATTVHGLYFTLADDEPARGQALAAAAKKARAHAEAIARGLGSSIGSVLAAREAATSQVVPYLARDTAAGAPPATPIETGLVQVRATVTVEVELTQ